MVYEKVLIVPYGIETEKRYPEEAARQVLIVPYGIETPSQERRGSPHAEVLIVPYGIETTDKMPCRYYETTF